MLSFFHPSILRAFVAASSSRPIVCASSRALSAGSPHPLGSREAAIEKDWANKEDARLISAMRVKEDAKSAKAVASVASAKAAAAAAAAAASPPPSAEMLALTKIVPRATAEVKAKLMDWKRERF